MCAKGRIKPPIIFHPEVWATREKWIRVNGAAFPALLLTAMAETPIRRVGSGPKRFPTERRNQRFVEGLPGTR